MKYIAFVFWVFTLMAIPVGLNAQQLKQAQRTLPAMFISSNKAVIQTLEIISKLPKQIKFQLIVKSKTSKRESKISGIAKSD